MAELTLAGEPFGISAPDVLTDTQSGDNAVSRTSELISQAAEDKSALEQLYLRYKADVFAFSLSLYNNRTIAEDCVQETFIRLPAAARSYKPSGSAAAFILGIAKNVSRELYRSEVRFRAGAAKMEEQTPLDAAPQSGALELVRELPKKYRTALTLRIYSGMTFSEIAKLLRLPESTVKSRYRRAVGMVAERFRETENGIAAYERKEKADEK